MAITNISRVSAQVLTTLSEEPSSSINVSRTSLQLLTNRLEEPSSSINVSRLSLQVLANSLVTPPSDVPEVSGSFWGWGLNDQDSPYRPYMLGIGDAATLSFTSPIQIGTSTDWKDFSCASEYALAIKNDGTLWVWGSGQNGELGLGVLNSIEAAPVKVSNDTDWKRCYATGTKVGGASSFAIKTDGTLWAWGANANYPLGLGDTTSRTTPTQVGTGSWYAVSSNGYYSLAINSDGTLWGWGLNSNYQLGLGDTTTRTIPTLINTTIGWKSIVATTNNNQSFGVKADGTLWAWGKNTSSSSGSLGLPGVLEARVPRQIGSDKNWESVTAVSNSETSIFARKTNGTLWAWGYNNFGELGLGVSGSTVTSPTQIGSDTDWKTLNYGPGLKNNGTLWAWGKNAYGQLGQGDTVNRSSPTQIGTDTDWLKVGNFNDTMFAIRSASAPIPPPPAVTPTPLPKITGSLWGWGANYYSQLGVDTSGANVSSSIQIGSDTTWKSIALDSVYGEHALGVKDNGTLWSWGANSYGQLGLGDTTDRTQPTQVGADTNWDSVYAGYGCSFGIKANGTLWAWGYNDEGQLGIGYSGSLIDTPTQVGTDSWYTIAASNYTLGIKNDGTLWSWGPNNTGQLGLALSDTVVKVTPTQIGSDTWKSISAGDSHAIAVRSDGTLWSWGRSYPKALGLGNNTLQVAYPNQVGSDSTWDSVKTNFYGYSSFASKTDGTLWSWGENGLGELGISVSGSDVGTPTQIGVDSDWQTVTRGLAIKTDGSLWLWGLNDYGQLGIGTEDSDAHPTPTQIV